MSVCRGAYEESFRKHTVLTVGQIRWAGIPDDLLLRRAAASFDALITVDRNFAAPRSASSAGIRVVILRAVSNNFVFLSPLMPEVLRRITSLRPGEIIRVGP
jgi:hypothetical protein